MIALIVCVQLHKSNLLHSVCSFPTAYNEILWKFIKNRHLRKFMCFSKMYSKSAAIVINFWFLVTYAYVQAQQGKTVCVSDFLCFMHLSYLFGNSEMQYECSSTVKYIPLTSSNSSQSVNVLFFETQLLLSSLSQIRIKSISHQIKE